MTSSNIPLSASSPLRTTRIASIDILRAVTMTLMIFVNDLGSLTDIPGWLEHVERGVDGIGLADVVFPAFLFIVDLSLPYAVDNRRKKGDTDLQIIRHILFRTVALLVMGVFLVNGETYNAAATGMARMFWNPLCCFCFILIWNAHTNKWISSICRIAGGLILVALAIIYRGGEEGIVYRFSPHWWGILGLIGWAYLASALITVLARNRFYILFAGWLFFCLLSMAYKAHWVPRTGLLSYIPEAIKGGTLTGLTMGGVVASFIFRKYRNQQKDLRFTVLFLVASVILIGLSVYTRTFWGLAKLGATPAWLFLCSAFTLITFTIIYWIADKGGKVRWFNIVRPAGTDTLLCYLIPYFVSFIRRAFAIHFPAVILTGAVGLLKSFLLALLCIWITHGLNKLGIRLKL